MRCIGKSGQARAAAASAGADGGWNSDTGREFRHGQKCAQPSISTARDYAISRGFGDCATSRTRTQFRKRIILSVPPTHPTSPFHSLAVRCCMASERSCSLGPPPTPPPPPSQCWAGPETPRRMTWRDDAHQSYLSLPLLHYTSGVGRDRPPPHHHPLQCWAGPAARRGSTGVLSHACTWEKLAPGEITSK